MRCYSCGGTGEITGNYGEFLAQCYRCEGAGVYYECDRCTVWHDVGFNNTRAALEHAIACHPNKLVDAILGLGLLDGQIQGEDAVLGDVFDDSKRAKGGAA